MFFKLSDNTTKPEADKLDYKTAGVFDASAGGHKQLFS